MCRWICLNLERGSVKCMLLVASWVTYVEHICSDVISFDKICSILIIITELFIQYKLLSGRTTVSKYMHTHAHANMLTIHDLIYSQLKQITNRNLRQRKIAVQSRKYGRFIVLEKEMFWDWVWCYLLSTYHSNCTLDMHGVHWLRSVFCDFCSTFLCSHMFTGQVDVMLLFLTNRCVRDMIWKPGGTAHIS